MIMREPGEVWTEYRAAVMYKGGDIRETYATRYSYEEAREDFSELDLHRERFEPKVYAAVVERTRTEPSDWRESTPRGAAPTEPKEKRWGLRMNEEHLDYGARQLSAILRTPVKANDAGEIEVTDFQIKYLKSLMPVLVDQGLLHERSWMGIPLRRIEEGSASSPPRKCPGVGAGGHSFASWQMFGDEPKSDICVVCGLPRNDSKEEV